MTTTRGLKQGHTLGRYELLAPIASGGMARVWAARLRGHAGFSKIVALKTILSEHASDPEFRAMFLDEARIAAKVHHPNVCETFDLVSEDDVLSLAMEWVDGVALQRVYRKTPIAERIAARIIADACAGLHAAHEALADDGAPLGIVHRDVSPQNLLLGADGVVKVTDFGVAKALGKTHATATGQVKGKLAYMAPEQLSANVDRRSDVWSLGAVLYEITTGKKPFDGETDAQIARALLLGARLAPPSEIAPGYPKELEAIVLRALSYERKDRYQTAEAMRVALEAWLARVGQSSTADVAALVRSRAGSEIESRRAELRALCTDPAHLPELPPEDVVPVSSTIRPAAVSPSSSKLGIVLASTWFAIAIAAGVVAWVVQTEAPPAPPPVVAVAPPAAPPPTAIETRPTTRAVPEPAPEIAFNVSPEAATLIVDGEAYKGTSIPKPAPGETKIVLVRAAGRADRVIVVDSETPAEVDVDLGPLLPLSTR